MIFTTQHPIDAPDCLGYTIVNSFNGEESGRLFTTLEAVIAAVPEVSQTDWGSVTQGSLKDYAIVVPVDTVWAYDHRGGNGFPVCAWHCGDNWYRCPQHPWNFNKLS